MRIDLRYRGGANNQNGTVWFDELQSKRELTVRNHITVNQR